MTTYYAVCDANGPISVRLESESLDAALAEFEAADTRAWIDGARTDAEDDLDIDGQGMDESEFDNALRQAGASAAHDLSEVVNAYSGQQYHVSGGWYLWALDS